MGLNDIDYMDSEIGRVELSAQFKLKQIHDITNSLLDNKNSNNKPMKSDFTIGYMVAIINVIDYLSNNEDKHMDWTQKKPTAMGFGNWISNLIIPQKENLINGR